MADATQPAAPADRWRAELAAWRIPDEIVAAAPESPYGFPVAMFQPDAEVEDTPSRQRALTALPDGGTVLDVGCGAGRAGLALVPPAGRLVGVDSSQDMLTAFRAAAAARGVSYEAVSGSWPEVADEVQPADVVVAHHVAYNVPDLAGFALALTDKARHRVVLELTDVHPWVPTNPLWWQFHRLGRPTGPTADLAAAVLREAGLDVAVDRWQRRPHRGDRATTVAFVRRRLCLPPERDPEVDAALPEGYEFSQREVATLWWDRPLLFGS